MDLNNLNKILIVAELSANHNGSLKIAIETIKAAKRAGADAIKLQTYTSDSLTLDSRKKDFIINNGSLWDGERYYDLYQKAQTPWEWHQELFNVAKEEGLLCFSSPFDIKAVDFLEELENPIYKIASFEITDIPLIKYIAKKNKPIIISTGISTKEDIKLALDTCRKEGNEKLALLKCTSSYPAPLNEANLLTMNDIAKTFSVVVGLSDHTLGITAPIVAASLGAKIIEKHFKLNNSLKSPDASFSLDEIEFKKMSQAIRETETLLGKVDYTLTQKQKKGRDFSRSIYLSKDVKKGEIISKNNIRSIRPGFGLHPKYFESLIGKKFNKDLECGDRMKLEYVDDAL